MTTALSSAPGGISEQALLGDRIMLAAIVISALAALYMGFALVDAGLAVGVSLLLLALAFGTYASVKGSFASSMVMAFVLTAMVVLHIQLARGVETFHFGVFVTLALVMVYLDWRPVVLSAALFAVHHVVFDRLLAAGFGFYCLSEPDFGRIVLHAVYVVIQTGLEIILVVRMRQAALSGEELNRLVMAIDRGHTLSLDVTGVPVNTPLALKLQASVLRMRDVVLAVQDAAAQINSASHEIATGNHDLSARTEKSASSLVATSTHVQHLSQAVRESAQAAQTANDMAATNARVAADGGQVVNQVVSTMEDINHSSKKIADIISVIDGIAFQTNILALNAAVEAARAGEQGRGFAVVAGEVRNLAQRSAQAAKEIKDLIVTSVERVEVGSTLVTRAGATIGEIVVNAQRMSDIISGIRSAGAEQAQGIGEVNEAIAQLDQTTQQNAALVEQSAAAAQSLASQAQRLTEAVAVFHVR